MSRRILLADDSVTIQKVIELTFMDEDYEVTAIGNGDEAVGALSRERPDFVIADVHMPGANGYEVCRRAKELYPDVPVLLLVGTFEPFDEARSRDAGADAFLKKPFDSQELLQLVGRLLGSAAGGTPQPAYEEETTWPSPAHEPEEAPLGAVPSPAEPAAWEAEPFPWGEEPTAAMPVPPADVRPIGFRSLDRTLEERAEAPEPPAPAPQGGGGGDIPFPLRLSDDDVERIARRVAELVSERVLRDVAWEVVPDMAEVVIKERLRELESEVE